MKLFIIIIIVIVGLLLIFQIYTIMASIKTETQYYKVIRKEKSFEIRYYPEATMAMISNNAKTYKDLGNSGFGKLAKYIFGGNNENKQIAMTSPVHMEIENTKSTMSFVLPSGFKKFNLPKPNDSTISIVTSEPEYVAVIQFNGFASAKNINEHKALLENALKEKGLAYHGNFRFLGYNPPYQLLARKNEVIVALNSKIFEK